MKRHGMNCLLDGLFLVDSSCFDWADLDAVEFCDHAAGLQPCTSQPVRRRNGTISAQSHFQI